MAELSKGQKVGGVAAICAAAAAVCLPLTQSSEGLKNKPYLDPAHILTVCFGETEGIDPARIYSNGECAAKLRHRLASDYAPRIAACLPGVANEQKIKVFGALLDAAYNAGPVAVCKSRMAVAIRAGQWRQGCNGFYGWYTTARNRKTGQRIALKGLVIRRQKEAALCLEGLGQVQALTVLSFPTSATQVAFEAPLLPPENFQGDGVMVTFFLGAQGVRKLCAGQAQLKPGEMFLGCAANQNGTSIIVLPNPCLFHGDFYADIACHEKAHTLGWRHG